MAYKKINIKYYNHKCSEFLSHLIGHEGQGSILSLLKQLNYANELYAYPYFNSTSCI